MMFCDITKPMSSQLPAPAGSNTFERIKRVNAEGNELWSARDLAQVLEYLNFRNFEPVIQKAKEACIKSGHAVADHFAEMRNMVSIGSGAQREVEDWALSCYACLPRNSEPTRLPVSRSTVSNTSRMNLESILPSGNRPAALLPAGAITQSRPKKTRARSFQCC